MPQASYHKAKSLFDALENAARTIPWPGPEQANIEISKCRAEMELATRELGVAGFQHWFNKNRYALTTSRHVFMQALKNELQKMWIWTEGGKKSYTYPQG